MNEEDENMTTDEWLNEHDSIQFELLKIKDEILKDTKEEKIEGPFEEKEKIDTIQMESESNHLRQIINGSSPPMPPFSRDGPEKKDLTDRDPPKIKKESKKDRPAPKLAKGKIPTSPDLNNKIANVLQLENKLKRRKYEMEKIEREEKGSKTMLRSTPTEGESSIEPTDQEILPVWDNIPIEPPSDKNLEQLEELMPIETGSEAVMDVTHKPDRKNSEPMTRKEPIEKKKKMSLMRKFRRRVFPRKD